MNNQQAINLLKGLEQSLDDYCELNDEGKTAFGMAITALELFGNSEQLPSAQTEPCDDPRADVYYLAEKIGIHRLYALVVELRGEPDPCEDAVPRTSVEYICRKNTVSTNPYEHKYHDKFIQFMDDPEISDFGRWQHSNGFNTALVAVKCDLDKVPSVTPKAKTGKWIYNSPVTMKCDQCGFVIKDWDWHRFKFCPNCDCDMRGEQE